MAQHPVAPRADSPRRWSPRLGSRLANLQVIFAFSTLITFSAKFVHISAHHEAVAIKTLHRWGFSFFAQDVALTILIRFILDYRTAKLLEKVKYLRYVLATALVFLNIAISLVAVTFYFVAGAELRWRDLALAGDKSSRGLILSGTLTFIVTVTAILLFSLLLQSLFFAVFGYAVDLFYGFFTVAWQIPRKIKLLRARYSALPQLDDEAATKYEANDDSSSEKGGDSDVPDKEHKPLLFLLVHLLFLRLRIPISYPILFILIMTLLYLAVTGVLLALAILVSMRPNDGTLNYLAWTTIFLPFVDFSSTPPSLQRMKPVFTSGIQHSWDKSSAVAPLTAVDWLTPETAPTGFQDWLSNSPHYNATADPMKISNLEEPVLSVIQDALQDVPIRHVMLIFLESTRHDMFPIKKDGVVWDRLADSFPNKKLPKKAQRKLANLTGTANYITGDYDDGFDHDEASMPKRGGIRFTNAQTTSTYTLKSLVGTMCGIAPMLKDFNLEYSHHIYQPCLPHIFEAMNLVDRSQVSDTDPYAASRWQSYYMMTAVIDYDNTEQLLGSVGFPHNHTIAKEYLMSDEARHGPVKLPDVNYFGFEEDPLEEYIRDAFISAKENDERVFLSHLTSTSHHPFGMPKSEEYVPLAKGLDDLSRYVNAEGYDNKWIRKILNVLDEQGVANETLVVFVGDHGLSMPENDVVSTYYNPSYANNHVPLVLSHPKLPAIDIDDPVSSNQILPTILDLLLETNSLDSASHRVATDLVRNYEGQSLVRPIQKSNSVTANWQYTVVNPGRSMISVRDARYPERYLVVPVVDHVEWRFTNTEEDPLEKDSVQGFSFKRFVKRVNDKHGLETAKWVEEAAFRTQWWVEENGKRWRYGLYAPKH
ncbi:hypothetical protein HJFPF1_00507 [Paramyrothecium foliicola]|nr:hypothetical protein HJFPF1_00507 [Paramyrothecium foliicola]